MVLIIIIQSAIVAVIGVVHAYFLHKLMTRALNLVDEILGLKSEPEYKEEENRVDAEYEGLVYPDETMGIGERDVSIEFDNLEPGMELFLEQLDEGAPSGYREAMQWESETE